MAKDKHKRKHQRAQQKADQRDARPVLVNEEAMAQKKTESSAKTTDNSSNNEKHLCMRFWGYITRPSITDWAIAAFTCALAFVAIGQYSVTRGQLTKMQKQLDQSDMQFSMSHRPWVTVLPGSVQTNDPLIFDTTGAHVSVSYTLKNGGTAPAIGTFTMSPGLVLLDSKTTRDMDYFRQMIGCDPPP